MTNKASHKKKSIRKVYIVSLILLVTLAFVVGKYLIEKIMTDGLVRENRNVFVQVEEQLYTLKNDFNTIDNGWEVKSICRNYGSSVTREGRTMCESSLVNSIDQKVNIEKYLELETFKKHFNVNYEESNIDKYGDVYTISAKSSSNKKECHFRARAGENVFLCQIYLGN